MATKTTQSPSKPKTAKAPTKKRENVASLKKKIAELEEQNAKALYNYGKMLEQTANMQLKLNAMLGQMLQALFIVGIGPDELNAKCAQMFRRKVEAD